MKAEIHRIGDNALRPLSSAEFDRWRESNPQMHDDLNDLYGQFLEGLELLPFAIWLGDLTGQVKSMNRSAPRVNICCGLAQMKDYTLNFGANGLGFEEALAAVTPPDEPRYWKGRGKPEKLAHQPPRMEAAGLIERIADTTNPVGEIIYGYHLTELGIVYAHIKGDSNRPDLRGVADYWRNEGTGAETTNPWFLGATHPDPVVEEESQFSTSGAYMWTSLLRAGGSPTTLRERYQHWTGKGLGELVAAAYDKDSAACFKFLDEKERAGLLEDVLIHAMGEQNPEIRGDLLARLNEEPDADKQLKMAARYYTGAGVDLAVAQNVIDELVCRTAWAVAHRLIRHRMNDESPGRLVSQDERFRRRRGEELTPEMHEDLLKAQRDREMANAKTPHEKKRVTERYRQRAKMTTRSNNRENTEQS